MNQPNIIFLVWDACRYDKANRLGETFSSLSENNISFENAITPARWSLPSHVSLLSGKYPSEHGICTKHGSRISGISFVSSLSDEGYTNYGVSANGFASPSFNFDEDFDFFEYTMTQQHSDGIDISEATSRANELGLTGLRKYSYVLKETLKHESKIPSIYNFLITGINELGFFFGTSVVQDDVCVFGEMEYRVYSGHSA